MNEQILAPRVGRPPWQIVSSDTPGRRPDLPPLRARQVYGQVIAAAAVVLVVVGVLGAFASRSIAEREAVHDASQHASILAHAVIEPALGDGVATRDPAALRILDHAVRTRLLDDEIVRVKLWAADGTIVYSDEERLIGEVFALSEDEVEAFTNASARAEITDLSEPENRFERDQGKLLEVYRSVRTSGGETLLFEIYAPYEAVEAGTSRLWWALAVISLASLVVLVMLMLPVLWRLLERLARAQEQREQLLEHAVEASAEERRRIAANLHDGVVQELVAASYAVSGAAIGMESKDRELARTLHGVAATVRTGIGGLRSLLVDIYPPTLDDTGLVAALADLVTKLRTGDLEVTLDVSIDDPTGLDAEGERQIFRIALECLRNAERHSGASSIAVTLSGDDDAVVLEVVDTGVGFDPVDAMARPVPGHFGLRLMADSTARVRGRLRVASAPGVGTHWELRVPRA